MSDIPVNEPEDSGSAGTQQQGETDESEAQRETALKGLDIAEKVEGLAASQPRSLGGAVGAQLIAGLLTQHSHERQENKKELKDAHDELRATKERLADCRTDAAVLKERVATAQSSRTLHNLSITIGTILVGVGIDLYGSVGNKAFLVAGIGLLLLLFGWLPPRHKRETKE